MKTLLVQLCLVLVFIAFCLADPVEPKRSKFPSPYILTPSLRVGRRSESTWDPANDVKRRIGKMVSFPRIGRSDPSYMADDSNYGSKRPGSVSGMWFGPRLGRMQKRNGNEDYPSPWTYIIFNGDRDHYTSRLARDSEEIFEDSDPEGDGVVA